MPWTLFLADKDARHRRRAKVATFWLIVLTGLNLFLAVQSLSEGERIKNGVRNGVDSNNVKFCSVISTTINASTQAGAPQTPYGRRQLKNFEELFQDFDCPGKPEDYR